MREFRGSEIINLALMRMPPSSRNHTIRAGFFQQMKVTNKEIFTAKPVFRMEVPAYRLELTLDADLLVDSVIGLDEKKVKINGIEYDKMEALMKLINLKVLLKRDDILMARIRMLEEAIENDQWDKVRMILKALNLPLDVEAFLLTAIAYKVTRGHPSKMIQKIALKLYSQNSGILWLMKHDFVKLIRNIPPKKRALFKDSIYIKEKLMGLVWDIRFGKGLQESPSKACSTRSEQ